MNFVYRILYEIFEVPRRLTVRFSGGLEFGSHKVGLCVSES